MSRVTLYMPTHNRAVMLQRALESALAQTYPDVEVIVVDDGSSDNTPQVLADYQSRYPQLKVLRQPQAKGACAARNEALAIASGEFITGMDDDDELLPEHITELHRAFRPELAFVSASLLEDNGQQRFARRLDLGVHQLSDVLHYNKFTNQVFTLTERLRAVGGFDENFPAFQDYDTWVRLMERFGPAEKIASATYVWHTGHEQDRISHSPVKRLTALEMFKYKHAHLLGKQHLASLEVMRIRMAGEAFSLRQVIKYINAGNWKTTVALYMNTNLKGLKRLIDHARR
ncbi:glycosyltransferase family A protein [Alkalimonas collagenimarina]|uniref:Glycosyltransferase family A protein n=1 Tax=Alkalimonas collagenimarina TaxID=400390 RepID=A0ABT9H0S1_9GAMM|nr:glycosyltransferase family A protein [Alkalimonas collagenimarina]MDP4536911.1 glycosyltransferase family A protein [Alkalimonas collagenimarina]